METFTLICSAAMGSIDIQELELYCPNGREGASFATYFQPDREKKTVPIDPRLTLLFFVLFMARYNDMMTDQPDAMGWRLQSELADEIGKITRWRVEEATVSSYLMKLNKLLAGLEHRLFESRRKRGIRVADGFRLTLILGRPETEI